MSTLPDLRDLSDVLKVLAEDIHSISDLDQILFNLLPRLLPEVTTARIYRVFGGQVLLLSETGGNGETLLDESPLHQSALQWLEPTGEDTRWVAPLVARKRALALLDVECAAPPEDTQDFTSRLRLAAQLLVPAVQSVIAGEQIEPAPRGDNGNITEAQTEASNAIFRAGNPAGVLGAFLRFTGGRYSRAHIALRDDRENPSQLHIVAEAGDNGEQPANRFVQLEGYPAHEALRDLEALYIPDTHDSDNFAASEFMDGARSLLILPLAAGGQLTGLIALSHHQPVALTPFHLEALRSLAEQAAVVMENQRLLADSEQRARQLQHIARFSQALQGTLDIETIARTMLDETLQLIALDRMNIALYDPIFKSLRLIAQYEDGKSRIMPTGGPLLQIRGAFIVQVWEQGEFLVSNDVYGTEDIRRVSEDEVRSLMIAPLLSRGHKLGLVSVGSVRVNAFRETDVAVFQQMANQLANALANAEAYAQSQRQAANEAFVNALSTRLEKQLDIRQMLDITLRELGTSLGARRGRIRLSASNPGRSGG
ncbi:MAG: GAF domain-containing protein [Chloroflexota bacterium]|nr:MAG: hypothetical protein DIU68_18685 [Chloroflexota bacterium]